MINESNVLLKEVLELPLFKTSKLLTEHEDLNMQVTSVNVMLDKEIIDWIGQDGQLILTTGQIFEKVSVKEQIELFKAIAEKNVTAVFIKITPYIEALEPEVIKVCSELNLAVVDLDYQVSFTEIFSTVYSLMFARQSAVLQRVENLHKDTMNVVINGGNLDDILRSIQKTITSPVFIRDYYFEDTYFIKKAFEDDYALLYENIEGIQLDGKNSKLIWDTVTFKEREIERLIIPIFVKNQVFGHIVTYGKDYAISNYDKLGLEATSNIIALEFLKKISVQEVENKYKLEFFDDLIALDEVRRQKAIERASNFRFSESANYVIIDVNVSSKQTIDESEKALKAAYLIEMICKDMGRAYMILNKSDRIYVLIMLKEGEGATTVKKYVKYIYDILKSKMKKYQTQIGVGRIYKGLNQVHKSLQDAIKALEAATYYIEDEIVLFEEMGIYKILSNSAIQTELEIFYKDILEPLALYDKRKDTELVKTLEVYYECNGNLKKMSEHLYTHYNTVLYRLSRIQEIMKIDLDKEEHRYAAQTALKVHKILRL
ncbi:helix-turn-helix domain-containing protein [Fusibacter bizertensis]|uniref:Helix-turn-helix domain-containing protein n=1 Tax=Fusibacter bizertensis TaxID=1488331 RepID=A0ABT6NDX7_9FIRM|nr:PucR family transcriptional regulator [Fusibacter bizertensis]MDH8678630.1 helix-turn-helix domain-containing protein [Fusibacter bizertensis]